MRKTQTLKWLCLCSIKRLV